MRRVCFAVVLVVFSFVVNAQDINNESNEEKQVLNSSIWKSELSLGLIATTGNTETTNASFALDVENDRAKWRHFISLKALYSKEDDSKTGQKLEFLEKSDYKLPQNSFLFGAFDYEDDRFSGYDYQTSISFGYGNRLLSADNYFLDAEIGPGYRYSKYESDDSESEFIVRLGGKYEWTINPTTKFKENLSVEIGSESTITKSTTSFVTQITGSISMKTALDIKHSSDVPEDTKKLDTKTSISLVYSF